MTETNIAGWGQGWYVRAHNIPEEFRSKICCHCGRIIKWSDPVGLEEVEPGFTAHAVCASGAQFIHMPIATYLRLLEKGTIKKKIGGPPKPVSDEKFQANADRCQHFLSLGFLGQIRFLARNLFSKEEL